MNELKSGEILDKLKELVERFSNNIEVYKSSRYDEENTKIDFIDKFFELLGWDLYNSSGASEDFREVIREDKVVIQGKPKSPDYSFKIGKERQFFVEAKKPGVNIYIDTKPSFQLRRYAYTAGLAISILTDFEELSIYDTSIKPNEKDAASVARIFYCKYTEYEKKWDFLNETISKQAAWQGKLKKFTTDNRKKKGTQSVDKELLKLIEEWRFDLAKNIALRNKELDIYQLNEAVQTIIDRIIFLRMAEDRNTEVYGFLQTLSKTKEIYQSLLKYFDSSNKKYNSGLFSHVPWIDSLSIDDKIFKSIVNDLYYPMPYEFSVLPIEILGQIYEQFLGKTIVLSSRHVASVEEKPEVRKAGGVYYTPKYIVDYIVENTIGKKIGVSGLGFRGSDLESNNSEPKSKTLDPTSIENLTILDPACGSGSFLVGAFKFLLNYHTQYYSQPNNIVKALKESRIYEAGKDDYRLTIREKKKILLNNIYGVDIDKQAVEVTKLSLLLTLMEGEITESRGEIFLRSVTEALLPNLDNNIKCGNSLIGTDFYRDKDLQLFGRDEQRKINCFDWEDEFPHIFKGKIEKFDKEYLENHWKAGIKKADEAIEIAIESKKHTEIAYEYAKKFEIVSEPKTEYNSKGSFDIVSEPKTEYFSKGGFDIVIGNPPYGAELNDLERSYLEKKFILKNTDTACLFMGSAFQHLKDKGLNSFIIPKPFVYASNWIKIREKLIDNLQEIVDCGKVWKEVKLEQIIYRIQNNQYSDNYQSCVRNDQNIIFLGDIDKRTFNQFGFYLNGISTKELLIGEKIQKSGTVLNNFIKNQRGSIYQKYVSDEKSDYKVLGGMQINKYYIIPEVKGYIKKEFLKDEKAYIKNNSILVQRIIAHIQNPIPHLKIISSLSKQLKTSDYIIVDTINQLENISKIASEYIIGILNSKLISWFSYRFIFGMAIRTMQFDNPTTSKIPYPKINLNNKTEKAQHDLMVKLVNQMLEKQKEAHSDKIKTEDDKKLINKNIKILDKQIDFLVYELYGLTDEEIKIVEGENN